MADVQSTAYAPLGDQAFETRIDLPSLVSKPRKLPSQRVLIWADVGQGEKDVKRIAKHS